MQLKRLFVSLLVVILILSATALVASAKDEADVVVFSVDYNVPENQDGSFSAKPGDIVEVSVKIDENSKGASKLEFTVDYDENVFAPVVGEDGKNKVTINEELNFKAPSSYVLDGAEEGEEWFGVLFYEMGNKKVIYRSDLGNKEVYEDTGVVLTLYFEVKEEFVIGDLEAGACGTTQFTVKNAVATRWNNEKNRNDIPVAKVVDGTCDVEIHGDEAAFTKVVAETAPTCTAEGSKTYSCLACGKTIVETIDKVPHAWETIAAVEPTCEFAGKTESIVCSVCGEVQKEAKMLNKLDHKPEVIPAVNPTETESGWTEGSKCSVCGKVLVEPKEIPAKGAAETPAEAEKSLLWLWILIPVVVVVLAGGGVLAYFLVAKKKKK